MPLSAADKCQLIWSRLCHRQPIREQCWWCRFAQGQGWGFISVHFVTLSKRRNTRRMWGTNLRHCPSPQISRWTWSHTEQLRNFGIYWEKNFLIAEHYTTINKDKNVWFELISWFYVLGFEEVSVRVEDFSTHSGTNLQVGSSITSQILIVQIKVPKLITSANSQ